MRRTLPTRSGAFGLILLLQVFVASSLLHPCCLAMGMEGPAASAVVEGQAHDSEPVASGSHAAHGPSSTHDVGSIHRDGSAPEGRAVSHAGHGSAAGHAGHGGHDADDDGCDGACGFCCQVAGVLGLPAHPASVAEADFESVPSAARARAAVLRSATAHLIPWANAPPTPRSAFA